MCGWRNHGQSSTDLPLLLNIKELAVRYLNHFSAAVPRIPSSPGQPFLSGNRPATPTTSTSPTQLPTLSIPIQTLSVTTQADTSKFRIGFITPPFRDTKIPVTDHLHAHAYVEPADLMGWWRSVAYSPVAWYAIDDLIAEIRQVTSPDFLQAVALIVVIFALVGRRPPIIGSDLLCRKPSHARSITSLLPVQGLGTPTVQRRQRSV